MGRIFGTVRSMDEKTRRYLRWERKQAHRRQERADWADDGLFRDERRLSERILRD